MGGEFDLPLPEPPKKGKKSLTLFSLFNKKQPGEIEGILDSVKQNKELNSKIKNFYSKIDTLSKSINDKESEIKELKKIISSQSIEKKNIEREKKELADKQQKFQVQYKEHNISECTLNEKQTELEKKEISLNKGLASISDKENKIKSMENSVLEKNKAQENKNKELLKKERDLEREECKIMNRITKYKLILHKIEDEADKKQAKNTLPAEEKAEILKILKIMDSLLENLPNEKIKEFANSNEFALYQKVLNKYKIT